MTASSPNNTVTKAVLVATGVALVCSVAVTLAAVLLRPQQQANRDRDQQWNVVAAAGLLSDQASAVEVFEQRITPRILDLETAEFTDLIDPADYDHRKAVRDPDLSTPIPSADDPALIKRRERYVPVFLTYDNHGRMTRIILPVRGYGLWSTLWGYLAVEGDGNTVIGLSFYSHGETPGLGGEVDNPQWKALWSGKKIYQEAAASGIDASTSATWRPPPSASGDESMWPALRVVKGSADPGSPHKVDGLSGATLTSRGVTHLLQYWLGPNGYGPFLMKIRAGAMAPADADGGVVSHCETCHGTGGASTHPDIPIIAGTSEAYLRFALEYYQQGEWSCREIHYPKGAGAGTDHCQIARGLSAEQIATVSEYFARQPFKAAAQTVDAALVTRGAELHARHCERCHSDGGANPDDDAGVLAGQWLPALKTMFGDYMSGERTQPRRMQKVMDQLTPADIDALINFYANGPGGD